MEERAEGRKKEGGAKEEERKKEKREKTVTLTKYSLMKNYCSFIIGSFSIFFYWIYTINGID